MILVSEMGHCWIAVKTTHTHTPAQLHYPAEGLLVLREPVQPVSTHSQQLAELTQVLQELAGVKGNGGGPWTACSPAIGWEGSCGRGLASNPGLPRPDCISQPWRKIGEKLPDFSPRLRDRIWARKAWVRG